MDSKLQDTAWYNDCYYKKKQMGTMQRNKNDGKDSASVADSNFSFPFSHCQYSIPLILTKNLSHNLACFMSIFNKGTLYHVLNFYKRRKDLLSVLCKKDFVHYF